MAKKQKRASQTRLRRENAKTLDGRQQHMENGHGASAVFAQNAASGKGAFGSANAQPKKESWLAGLFGNEHFRTFALSFAIVLGMLLYFFLAAKAVPPTTLLFEGPLEPVAQLSILPNESYIYVVRSPGGAGAVGYRVLEQRGCGGMLVLAYGAGAADERHCFGADGIAIGEGTASNLSATNSTFLLFAPWMLAVEDGWGWAIRTEVREGNFGMVGGEEMLFGARRASWNGRDAFLVGVRMQNRTVGRFFIDAQKRVLLYMEMGASNATLVDAPFFPKNEKFGGNFSEGDVRFAEAKRIRHRAKPDAERKFP